MARIAGIDLPRNKRSYIALTYIYGIGTSRANRILDAAKVDPMKKIQDLAEDEVNRIRTVAIVTAATCRSADSAPTPTRVPARAHARERSRLNGSQPLRHRTG